MDRQCSWILGKTQACIIIEKKKIQNEEILKQYQAKEINQNCFSE